MKIEQMIFSRILIKVKTYTRGILKRIFISILPMCPYVQITVKIMIGCSFLVLLEKAAEV